MENKYFVVTKSTKHALNLLKDNNCVAVIGGPGAGKSSVLHHMALKLQLDGYEVINAVHQGPFDIQLFNNQAQKQVYVFDDPFGQSVLDLESVQKWYDTRFTIMDILGIRDKNDAFGNSLRKQLQIEGKCAADFPHKLIISCRLHIYKANYLKRLKSYLNIRDCNIQSNILSLSPLDKKSIFLKYIDSCTFEDIPSDVPYFPLVCRQAYKKSKDEVQYVFKTPPQQIREDMEIMAENNIYQLCCFGLCVLFDNAFDVRCLEVSLDKHMDE